MHSLECCHYVGYFNRVHVLSILVEKILSCKVKTPFLRYSNGKSDYGHHTLYRCFFVMTSQLKHWKHYVAQLFTYDVIMKNNGKCVMSVVWRVKSRFWTVVSLELENGLFSHSIAIGLTVNQMSSNSYSLDWCCEIQIWFAVLCSKGHIIAWGKSKGCTGSWYGNRL